MIFSEHSRPDPSLSPVLQAACDSIVEVANGQFVKGEFETSLELCEALETILNCFAAEQRKNTY